MISALCRSNWCNQLLRQRRLRAAACWWDWTLAAVMDTPHHNMQNSCLTSSRELTCWGGWKRPCSRCRLGLSRYEANSLQWSSWCYSLCSLLPSLTLRSKFWQPDKQHDVLWGGIIIYLDCDDVTVQATKEWMCKSCIECILSLIFLSVSLLGLIYHQPRGVRLMGM